MPGILLLCYIFNCNSQGSLHVHHPRVQPLVTEPGEGCERDLVEHGDRCQGHADDTLPAGRKHPPTHQERRHSNILPGQGISVSTVLAFGYWLEAK